MKSFRTAEDVLFYFSSKPNFALVELFALADQVTKLAFPLPTQDPRFKQLVASLARNIRPDEAQSVDLLSHGSAVLLKFAKEVSLAPKILAFCPVYKDLFTTHRSALSANDFVHTVALLAKFKSVEIDAPLLRQLMEHVPALRPVGLALMLEIVVQASAVTHKELRAEIVSRTCLNIRSSDHLTAYPAADLTVALWKFFPHMRTAVARGALYDLAKIWIPKFPVFTLNRKIQTLQAASELHVSLPEIDGLVRAVVRQTAGRSEIVSPNRLAEIVNICAIHNFQADHLDDILGKLKNIDKSPFMLTADNRANLLWALHVLDRDNHPVACALIEHFHKISDPQVPFSLRSTTGSTKKLFEVATIRSLRSSGRAAFAPPLLEALAAADASYFDRCIATTGFFRDASESLKADGRVNWADRENILGIVAPLMCEKSRVVVEFDTGRDSYNFRLRKQIWKHLGYNALILTERMWRTVRRSKTQGRYITESLDKILH